MGVYRYHGPALTPAEVDARIAAVHKEWLAEDIAAAIRALKGEGNE
jgi:hypothetical protein